MEGRFVNVTLTRTHHLTRPEVLTLAATFPSWLLVVTPTHAEVSSPEGTVRYVAESEPVGVAS